MATVIAADDDDCLETSVQQLTEQVTVMFNSYVQCM